MSDSAPKKRRGGMLRPHPGPDRPKRFAGGSIEPGAAGSSAQSSSAEVRGRGKAITLGSAMTDFLRSSGLGRQLRHGEVYGAFARAIGPALSKHARPVQFASGKLVVEVDSAPHLHELKSFLGEDARHRANRSLGEERILQITFKAQA